MPAQRHRLSAAGTYTAVGSRCAARGFPDLEIRGCQAAKLWSTMQPTEMTLAADVSAQLCILQPGGPEGEVFSPKCSQFPLKTKTILIVLDVYSRSQTILSEGAAAYIRIQQTQSHVHLSHPRHVAISRPAALRSPGVSPQQMAAAAAAGPRCGAAAICSDSRESRAVAKGD